MVCVGPPLFCNGLSMGLVLFRSPLLWKLQDARRAHGKVVEMVRKAGKPEESTVSGHNKSLNVPECARRAAGISG